jgi:hypothetical protein
VIEAMRLGGAIKSGDGRHRLAIALAVMLAAPFMGLASLAGQQTQLERRVLVIALPWRDDTSVVGELAISGAEWFAPLWLPGAWLVSFPDGQPAPLPSGMLALPVAQGGAFLAGCGGNVAAAAARGTGNGT